MRVALGLNLESETVFQIPRHTAHDTFARNIRLISVRRARAEEVALNATKDFEQRFDEGNDLTALLDLSKVRRVLQAQKRVNVDFPTWMIDSLNREASKLGVTPQSII